MSSAPGHMVQMQVLVVKFPEVATVRKVKKKRKEKKEKKEKEEKSSLDLTN